MPRLDIVTLNIATGSLEAGESQYVVAQHHNVHRSTISRLRQRYLRTGRPRITTAQQDRYIHIFHHDSYGKTDSFKLIYLTFAEYPHHLREVGLSARRPYILVPFWDDRIGVQGSDGATQLGTGL
jgi:hypothetical protein